MAIDKERIKIPNIELCIRTLELFSPSTMDWISILGTAPPSPTNRVMTHSNG